MNIFIKTVVLFCLSNFLSIINFAQNAIMIHEGEIEFEKRVNAFAILDEYYIGDAFTGTQQFTEQHKQFAQQYKANNPQFSKTNFTLSFNDDYSLYNPTQNTTNNDQISLLTTKNIVYSDLKNNTFVAKKSVLGDTYIVNDSIRKIQWKITNETREIAGFNCRRANAIIMDSVYVVAFYTDQIVPKTGPESFTGLPGMVLGIVLPHEHITWFATKVFVKQIPNEEFKPPSGGKNVNNEKFLHILIDNPSIYVDKSIGYLYLRNFIL